jgi:hypothetical protein
MFLMMLALELQSVHWDFVANCCRSLDVLQSIMD